MKTILNRRTHRYTTKSRIATFFGSVALATIWHTGVNAREDSQTAASQAEVPMPEAADTDTDIGGRVRFEGIVSADYKTHFVSYGRDIWGAGSGWTGDHAGTFNPWLQLTIATDLVQVYAGTWLDINSKGSNAEVGDKIQEVDVWAGVSLSPGRFRTGATYQKYFFLDRSDGVIDVWVAYADYGQVFSRFGLNPRAVLHFRDFGNTVGNKTAILVGVNPWLTLTPSLYYPVSLSLPTDLVFFEKGFHGGDDGFGFWSIGPVLHVPLTQKPRAALRFTATIGLTWFMTDRSIIPTNPDENFLRGNIGITANF